MNIGKAQYDDIPIPKELDRVIEEAVSRAEREARAQRRRRWLAGVAAILAGMLILSR